MKRTVDMAAVWNQATEMLSRHREAIIAIAGLLIFIPNWASAYFVPEPDIEGLTSMTAIFEVIGQNFIDHWMVVVPLALIGLLGSVSVLIILLRADHEHVGDALKYAAALFPLYLAVSLLSGLLMSFGTLAFIIGFFYVAGRLMVVGPIVVAEPDKGIGAIKRAWDLTSGAGWKCFLLLFVIVLVTWIIMAIVSLVVGTICALAVGPEGVPLIEHFFTALTGAAFSVTVLAVEAALYRHLQHAS